jgi:hypothetical protein
LSQKLATSYSDIFYDVMTRRFWQLFSKWLRFPSGALPFVTLLVIAPFCGNISSFQLDVVNTSSTSSSFPFPPKHPPSPNFNRKNISPTCQFIVAQVQVLQPCEALPHPCGVLIWLDNSSLLLLLLAEAGVKLGLLGGHLRKITKTQELVAATCLTVSP